MNTQHFQRDTRFGPRAGLAALILTAAAARAAVPEGRSLDIGRQGTAITLQWLGILNAPYEAQGRDHLARDDWTLLDTVIGADGPTAYTVPTGGSSARFFRVLFPQPAVPNQEFFELRSCWIARLGAGGVAILSFHENIFLRVAFFIDQ